MAGILNINMNASLAQEQLEACVPKGSVDECHAACRDISVGNAWLVACSLIHMGLAMLLVKPHGAVGLIAADAVNMVLRIAFCLAFVARHFRAVKGFRLQGLLPSRAAFAILAAASAVCLAADSILFKGAALPSALQVGHLVLPICMTVLLCCVVSRAAHTV